MTDLGPDFWLRLAIVEWRLVGIGLLAFSFAAGLGMNAVWGSVESSTRSLLISDRYLSLLEGTLIDTEDLDVMSPLRTLRRTFVWATRLWFAVAVAALVGLAAGPISQPSEGAQPTIWLPVVLLLLCSALAVSGVAWSRRLAMDDSTLEALSKSIKEERRKRRRARLAS